MFVRTKKKAGDKVAVQIVESFRRGDKVQQNIVRHIGQASNEREIEELTKLAQSIIYEIENNRQPTLPLFAPEKLQRRQERPVKPNETVEILNIREEQRVNDGIGDVFGKLHDDLGFGALLSGSAKAAQWNEILKNCIIARLANPVSKRRTASLLEQDFGIKIPLEKIYRMMDEVAAQEESIKSHIGRTTRTLFDERVDVLFFDVTTLYFESFEPDGFRENGFSKDCKFKETQVILALVATTGGLPITYQLFPGDLFEGRTLVPIIRELKEKHSVKNVTLVADRAMFAKENLAVMDELGVHYIVAAKLRALPAKSKNEILNADFDPAVVGDELQWLREFEHDSRRLIVSYSSKRAKKDADDRQRLIDRLLKKVAKGKIPVKSLIPNYGTKKYLHVEGGVAEIDQTRIDADGAWDGLHGVITNLKEADSVDILTRYRDLWQIEEAFRVSKHDLRMRPIFHWTEKRIRAHIAICFIAFTVIKQALHRYALQQAPMSFEQMREELLHVQSSIMVDLKTKKKFRIPSHITTNQKKIYQVFGLKRSEVPTVIL